MLGPINLRWSDHFLSATGEKWRNYLDRKGSIDEHETLKMIDWVIVGGESGHNARPMHPAWVRQIRDHCKEAGVSFFFKQWGEWAPYLYIRDELKIEIPKNFNKWGTFGVDDRFIGNVLSTNGEPMLNVGKNKSGRFLDGVLHDEYPKAK